VINGFGGSNYSASGMIAQYQNNLSLVNNTITGGTGSTNLVYGINVSALTGNVNMNGNNLAVTSNSLYSSMYGIEVGNGSNGANPNLIKINGNQFNNFTNPGGGSLNCFMIRQNSSASAIQINNNIFDNCTKSGPGYWYFINISNSAANAGVEINDNMMNSCSTPASCTMTGIESIPATGSTVMISRNTLTGFSSNGGNMYGIRTAAGSVCTIMKNRIYDFTTQGNGYNGQGLISGIYIGGGSEVRIYNNMISDPKTPSTVYPGMAIDGIFLSYSQNNYVFNNTIYLNASSNQSGFSTDGINIAGNVTNVSLKNNIIVNLSVPGTSTGSRTVALVKSVSSLTNYAADSDNNLFYCGTPDSKHLVYTDGTNNFQTLGSFQSWVSPREVHSVTEMPPFINAAVNNLHLLNPASLCSNVGISINTPFAVSEDFDGDIRYGFPGYNGGGTAPDIGADEFSSPYFGLNLKVFLQGAFSGTAMTNTLQTSSLIPLSKPYNQAPWNYSGTESVAGLPSAGNTDWVLVELRDAATASGATASTVIARQAAFQMSNGNIRSLDGTSNQQFDNLTIQHSLFAVIYHRNHLAIMSALPLSESGGIYSWDFRTGAGQAYNNGQKNIASGVWGMFAGDANADGLIEEADKIKWEGQAGTSGYLSGDIDMNGQVDNKDKNDFWLPNFGEGTQVPD
jgi:hypothetical protein